MTIDLDRLIGTVCTVIVVIAMIGLFVEPVCK